MDLLYTILAAAGTAGLLVWLTRTWTSRGLLDSLRHEFELELEAHRESLDVQLDASLERLQAEAQGGPGQQHTLDAVTGMCDRLESLRDLCAHYSAIRPRDMKAGRFRWRDALEREIIAFERHFGPRRYTLPRDIAERTNRAVRELEREQAALLHVLGEGDGSDDGAAAVARSFRGMLEILGPIQAVLEDHARDLLGVGGTPAPRESA